MSKKWKHWERDFTDGREDYIYYVAFVGNGNRVFIQVLQDKNSDDWGASVYMNGERVCGALWTQCDYLRHIEYSTIPRCFAWIVDRIKYEFGIVVPMEEDVV